MTLTGGALPTESTKGQSPRFLLNDTFTGAGFVNSLTRVTYRSPPMRGENH